MSNSKSLIKVKEHSKSITHSTVGDILANYIIKGVPTMMGWVAALASFLRGLPLWAIILIGSVVFLILSFAFYFVEARRRTSAQGSLTEPPQEDLNVEHKRVEELTEQLRLVTQERDSFEKHRDSAIKAYEEASRKIKRLEHNETALQMSITSKIQDLEKYQWLYEIAERDKEVIQKRVVVESFESIHFNMESDNAPFIEYTVTVFNASVYRISVRDDVKGRISYREPSYPLAAAPSIRDNTVERLPHGRRGTFKLYQWLSPHECDLIRKLSKENPKQPYYTKVSLENVSIYFTVHYPDGTSVEAKLKLPPTTDLPIWY